MIAFHEARTDNAGVRAWSVHPDETGPHVGVVVHPAGGTPGFHPEDDVALDPRLLRTVADFMERLVR